MAQWRSFGTEPSSVLFGMSAPLSLLWKGRQPPSQDLTKERALWGRVASNHQGQRGISVSSHGSLATQEAMLQLASEGAMREGDQTRLLKRSQGRTPPRNSVIYDKLIFVVCYNEQNTTKEYVQDLISSGNLLSLISCLGLISCGPYQCNSTVRLQSYYLQLVIWIVPYVDNNNLY